MTEYIFVALGGALGALLRFFTYKSLVHFTGANFPYATLFVNCFGSLLFGLFLQQIRHSSAFSLFFAVGFLGSLTTFSTFSYETIQLLKDGKTHLFLINIMTNVFLALIFFVFGDWINTRYKFF